jgi:hypothetical protein
MRGIMPAIIDQAGRPFNVDKVDGVSRRHRRRHSDMREHLADEHVMLDGIRQKFDG